MRLVNAVLSIAAAACFSNAVAACPTINIPEAWKKFFCEPLCAGAEPVSAKTCPTLPECPPNTKPQAADASPASSIPADGYFLLGIKGKNGLFKSPLRNYAPVVIPNTSHYKSSKLSTTIHIVDVHHTGTWILFTDRPYTDSAGGGREWRQNVHVIKSDGTNHIEFPNAFNGEYIFAASWFGKSPMGEEIAILTYNYPTSQKPNVHAIKVEFKSDGTAAFGTTRQIGKELGGALWGEFGAGGEFIAYREKGVNGSEPVSVFTIPDGGRGMATRSTRYNGHFSQPTFNCGITVSPDGKFGAWNTARTYVNCITGGHHGVNVLELRRNTDPVLNAYDWYFNHGTFSWAPLNLTKLDPDLHIYKWTNHLDYIATHDQQRQYGAFLVNWRTGTWYALTPNSSSGTDVPAVYPNVAAYVEGGTSVGHAPMGDPGRLPPRFSPPGGRIDPLGRATVTTRPGSRREGLARWRLLLGESRTELVGARGR